MSDFLWGKRPAIHSTAETWRTLCDGCLMLDCQKINKSKLHPWRYYCDRLHEEVDIYSMTTEKCPEKRKAGRHVP